MSVYFAQRRRRGLIKIGYSRGVTRRLKSKEIRARLLGSIPGFRKEERETHARFAHLRVRGEWFRPGEDLLAFIHAEAQGHDLDDVRLKSITLSVRAYDSLRRMRSQLISGGTNRLPVELRPAPGRKITLNECVLLAARAASYELERKR